MAAKLFATVNAGAAPVVLERTSPRAPWSLPSGVVADLVRTGRSNFSVILDGRSYNALVLKEDRDSNTVRIRIGAHTYTVELQDEQSRLMEELGLDKGAATMVKDLKAPMPGLVLSVLVKEGDAVKKGDPVLVLEAMKMENVIKAPGDATVAHIHAEKGKAVEKGQLLLNFA